MLDRFTHAARLQPLAFFLLLMVLFLSGYLAVWGGFGLVAFSGDWLLHRLVEALEPLLRVERLIGGGVLLLAGAYQFSLLKGACAFLSASRLSASWCAAGGLGCAGL